MYFAPMGRLNVPLGSEPLGNNKASRFGEKMRHYPIQRGLSLRELAMELGFDQFGKCRTMAAKEILCKC